MNFGRKMAFTTCLVGVIGSALILITQPVHAPKSFPRIFASSLGVMVVAILGQWFTRDGHFFWANVVLSWVAIGLFALGLLCSALG